jgi:hypothetical protein
MVRVAGIAAPRAERDAQNARSYYYYSFQQNKN